MPENVLFFDTETSNLLKFKCPDSDPDQPWIVQLAAVLCDGESILSSMNFLIQSCGLPMSPEAEETHGISVAKADQFGYAPAFVFDLFASMVARADVLIAHNFAFDSRLVNVLGHRVGADERRRMIKEKPSLCTMQGSTKFCALPFPSGRGGNKWPKLEELHEKLFGETFEGAHDALSDVYATRRCYHELVRLGVM